MTRAVLIAGVPPFWLKTAAIQRVWRGSVFETIQNALATDRYAFLAEFFRNVYNADVLPGKRVSELAIQAS